MSDITHSTHKKGLRVTLEHTLMEYHDREHWSPTIIAGKWHERPHHGKRHRREINLKVIISGYLHIETGMKEKNTYSAAVRIGSGIVG